MRNRRFVSLFALFAIIASGMQPPAAQAAPSVSSSLSYLRSKISAAGLIDSFVEDGTDYSYTYDNAMASLAFISAGDFTSARKVLDAYNAMAADPSGGFLHRYHAANRAPAEGILFLGPNCYLLQALNLYRKETGDGRYNALAQRLGNFMLTLQDADGGLFGRPGVTWKSTENNLAALSALHNLGKVQGIALFAEKAALVRDFLVTECWDGTRFLQGKNDPTVVTDVQALGALVLGSAYANGASWIEGQTKTTRRYQGRKTVTGFDQDTNKDTVWTEGTLQQSLAYVVAGDASKSSTYRVEAEKLSKSSGALALASNAGTVGPDWNVEPWQAAAPTAWHVLAAHQDNAFELLP